MNKQAIAETQTQYVHMKTDELLEVIQKNRTLHLEQWKKAHGKWHAQQVEKMKECTSAYQAATESAQSGGKIEWPSSQRFHLTEPMCHVKDYDVVIRRMELCIDEEMYLTHSDFDKFVMDEWHWKLEFAASNSMYDS